jgi:hypothetical protein
VAHVTIPRLAPVTGQTLRPRRSTTVGKVKVQE